MFGPSVGVRGTNPERDNVLSENLRVSGHPKDHWRNGESQGCSEEESAKSPRDWIGNFPIRVNLQPNSRKGQCDKECRPRHSKLLKVPSLTGGDGPV